MYAIFISRVLAPSSSKYKVSLIWVQKLAGKLLCLPLVGFYTTEIWVLEIAVCKLLLVDGPLATLVLWPLLDTVLMNGPPEEVLTGGVLVLVIGAVVGTFCGGAWLFLCVVLVCAMFQTCVLSWPHIQFL